VRSFGRIPAPVSCSRQVSRRGCSRVAAGRVLAEHRAHDDLVCGDHDLAVVPGHVAFLVAHHPDVRAGGVRPRPGAGPVRARRLISRAAPTPFPRCRGRVPCFLLRPLRVAARLVLSRQPVPGPGQPLPPSGPAGQRARRGRRWAAAVLRVAGDVSRSRLGENLLNLRRIERRPPVPISPVQAAELAKIQGCHCIQHDEGQIVLRQPLAHACRHQQRLVTLREKEILRHAP
jgi:hypothetical protein